MGLRIWDDPIDLPTFNKCMRTLDPTLTEQQLKGIAKEMKNANNRIDVIMMLQNLVGNEFETVDFRNRIYKRMYSELTDKRNADVL